jgi:hypothetical protein
MPTQRKIDSARANGAKSHGPITTEGRKKSSMNALKHGLTARTVVLSNENGAQYSALLESYMQDLQPEGPVEMDLVLEMVNAKWRQRRLHNIETELFERQMDNQKESLDARFDSYDEILEHTFAFKTLSDTTSLKMLDRMEPRLERTYLRALNNLLRLRHARQSTAAATKKDEKRTQSPSLTPPRRDVQPELNPLPYPPLPPNPVNISSPPDNTRQT